jgi:lysophospholipase L1-like esterase
VIEEKQIKPFFTLLITVVVMILLAGIMAIFPKDGIQVGSSTIDFPTFNEFFAQKSTTADSLADIQKDLSELFDSTVVVSEIDSTLIRHRLDSLSKYRKSIQLADNAKPALHRFFDALDNAQNKKVRIMHYGDSQIEADRITSVLRNELQTKFGGYGSGLFDVIQVAPKMSVNIEFSENWKRFPGFGRKDSTVKHNKYGPLMAFSRYTDIPSSTAISDSVQHNAWITLKKPRASYSKTKTYHLLKILLSNSYKPIHYDIIADGAILKSGTISSNTPFQVLTASFANTPEEISIMFSGADSPDIYGISLEGNNGVVVDNIPLRGSSGTIFTKQNQTLLSNSFANLSPNLIIMEFGGNVVPYVKDEKGCKEFGNWFKSQIYFMQKLNPNAAFIVIGPGDMSIKEGTEFVTYPQLEGVRDALKEASISSGCMFWDMYEVMGGRNSMPIWVNSDPSLAASDYIHFSPKGAKKIAVEFTNKLLKMYENYKNPTKSTEVIQETKDSTTVNEN